jgi:selenocysteine lyase/cysteine desulfurase
MGIRQTGVAAATAVGAAAVKKITEHLPSGWGPGGTAREDPTRWRAVTVNRSIHDLDGGLPRPLAELGDAVEVRLQPAPGTKGTEIHARLTEHAPARINDQEPVEALRSALRQAKQVAEVGYVLEADRNRTAKPTPLNEPLRQADRHAGGEGRL